MVMKLSTHSFTLTSPAEVAGMRCGCSEEQSSEASGVQPNSILERSCSARDENVALSLARSTVAKLKSKATKVDGPKMP